LFVWINKLHKGITMFLKETTETNEYTKKSKFGKLTNYTRTKTLTHWKCDNCNTEFTKFKNGKYDVNTKSYCKECVSSIGVNKLAGMAGYQAKIKNNFSNRVGKVVLGKEGYPEIYIGKDYPYRTGGYRCIREHQYIMELHLKRGLKKGEVVHHIDGDKTNNNIENLFLTTVQEHNKLHAESENIIFKLVKSGQVIFNRNTSRYELKN
jgi:HNH endonuclease